MCRTKERVNFFRNVPYQNYLDTLWEAFGDMSIKISSTGVINPKTLKLVYDT